MIDAAVTNQRNVVELRLVAGVGHYRLDDAFADLLSRQDDMRVVQLQGFD